MESLAQVQKRIGQNLKAIRTAKGLTQARLAEAVGVDERYYQRVERGTQPLTLRTIHRLATFLKISAGDLLAPLPRGKKPPPLSA